MRVLADACQDPGLTSLFASTEGGNKGDIYRRLAAQVCGLFLPLCKVYLDGTFLWLSTIFPVSRVGLESPSPRTFAQLSALHIPPPLASCSRLIIHSIYRILVAPGHPRRTLFAVPRNKGALLPRYFSGRSPLPCNAPPGRSLPTLQHCKH